MTTNVSQFIEELDGGVFEEKISRALSEVAAAVMDNTGSGSVTLTFDFKGLSESQVMVNHKLAYKRPTLRGTASEEDKTATPMCIGKGGALTFFPEQQTKIDFTEKED